MRLLGGGMLVSFPSEGVGAEERGDEMGWR